jgi:sugar transferase (PEP-CTERM/EpsH1 system associated)
MDNSTDRVSVVHLVSGLNIGGLEMVVLNLARFRNRDQFDLHVLCLEEAGLLAPAFAALDVPVESLGCARLPKGRTLLRLTKRLRQLSPDVLHTHNMNPHIFGVLAARLARVPAVVHTKHGRNYPDRRVAVFRNWFASCFTDRVVTVSEDAATVVREIERVPGRKVHVIRNGIDLERFAFVRRNEDRSGKHAVHVARLNISKDQTTLLEAARIVADAEPEFRLTIVGDGPKREELISLKEKLGLGAHVCFAGERDDVHRFLCDADFFVLSSVEEGIPLTILEAMATGLPVVATRVGGNGEVVIPDETGLLVEPRSPQFLAEAILKLIRNPAGTRQMGLASRLRVEREFNMRDVAQSYESLYLQCCATRRNVPSRTVRPTS